MHTDTSEVPRDTRYTWSHSCTSRTLRLSVVVQPARRLPNFSLACCLLMIITYLPTCPTRSPNVLVSRSAGFRKRVSRRPENEEERCVGTSCIERRKGGFGASRGAGLYSHLALSYFRSSAAIIITAGRSSQNYLTNAAGSAVHYFWADGRRIIRSP